MACKEKSFSSEDFLFIDGLEHPCRVGTTDEERAFPQIIRLFIEIHTSLNKAGETDDLAASVDYADVCRRIRDEFDRRQFKLIEALAEAAARVVLSYGAVNGVLVRAEKHVLPGAKAVGACIWRVRGEH